MSTRTASLALAFSALCAVLSAPALAAGGTIVYLQGNADVDRAGKKMPAAESFALYSGDTLSVPTGSVAQLRFEDDSLFVVPGTSKFRIDAFSMPAPGTEGKAIYTLVDGGLRTITGRVKGKQGQYELRTEEATIGVDGTAYVALRCYGSCARKHPQGLYVKDDTGIVIVASPGGSLKLKAGQIAFVAARGAAPIIVKISPFGDPDVAASFDATVEFNMDVHPPRIEPEPPASPS